MKIQRHLTDKRGNKKYYKYVVVLPEEIVKKASFKKGQEIKAECKKGEIKLKKR